MTGQLKIGEFIARKLNIPDVDLNKLLSMQEYLDDKIGEIALRENFVNKEGLEKILEYQQKNQIPFGRAAVFLGLIKNSQVKYLLDAQAKEKQRIGELLVQRKMITEEGLLKLLEEFYSQKEARFTILAFIQNSLSKEVKENIEQCHCQLYLCKKEEDLVPLLEKKKPQLVFLDDKMGESLELARKIREAKHASPYKIGLFTGKKTALEMLAGYECGIDYILPIPFQAKHLINIIIDSEIKTTKSNKQRILIVDDSPTARKSIADEFLNQGFQVLYAKNGKEGVETAVREKPDLISMDVEMPVMGGYQACLKLKENPATSDIPVIILTSLNTQEERKKGFEVGAVEYFTKPFTKGHLGSYATHILSKVGSVRPEKLIVADDDPIARKIFSSILDKQGFHFELADNGTAVLDCLKGGYKPSCIVLDCAMPGMDGFETCQWLKGMEKFRHIPVIMVTGAGNKENILNGFRVGADDYITKPFDGDELIARIEAHIRYFTLFQKIQKQYKLVKEKGKALEHEKERAEEANKLKDKFISLVAHDLRSPFTTIMGFLQIIMEDEDKPVHEDHRELMDMVLGKSRELLDMIESLLEIGRFKTGKIEPKSRFIDGFSVVGEALSSLEHNARKKGVSLICKVPNHTRLFADPRLLTQVIQNLTTNAIKFSKKGESITVYVPSGQKTVLAIKDTGKGIKESRLETLFKYEETTSTSGTAGEKGTGLGLPLSLDIMAAHGGTITVESEIEKGSTFCAVLPEVRPRILIVDDSKIVRASVIKILKKLDMDIVEAENGSEALGILYKEPFHLIVTDIIMPEMDGFELIQMVRKKPKTRDIPIIVITSDKKIETREKVFYLGADDFIAKPFSREDIIPRVRKFVL